MKSIKLFVLFAIVSFFTLQSCNRTQEEEFDPMTTAKYKKLNTDMHKLWADHMQWTYATVDAFFHDNNSLNAKLERLLQNQQEIGNSIKPYYGEAAGNQLAQLLTEHIQLAVPVLTAAKNNDQAALNTALANWYANADDIAHFLTNANPNQWTKMEMEHMMKMHIDQTVGYSVDLLNNNSASAVQKYDEAFNHMMEMADMLSEGIAKQFPDKFR